MQQSTVLSNVNCNSTALYKHVHLLSLTCTSETSTAGDY